MKVLALTRYGPLGPSSRIRCLQYVTALRREGIDLTIRELLHDEYVRGRNQGRRSSFGTLARWYANRLAELVRSGRYDLLWIGDELFPGLPATAERILARTGPPYVVEYDDAVFHRYEAAGGWLSRALLGHKIDVVMRKAAMVIAGNAYLADHARQAGARRVEILPSVVDLEAYPITAEPPGPFTIGWIGSPTTVSYLESIGGVLRAEHARGARLVAVGATRDTLPDLPFDLREWSPSTEAGEISRFSVGVMPLSDGPWERGKCGYKIIQCMACARPVIASAVGANASIVEHGVTGFLVGTEAEWAAAFAALSADPNLRRRMGQAGRRVVEKHYSLQINAPILASLLKSAAAERRRAAAGPAVR